MSRTAQEMFEDAQQHYLACIQEIDELSALALQEDAEFSAENAKREFDEILQCILLNVAMEDGVFAMEEKDFIAQITGTGDILARVRSELKTEITWESLYLLPARKREMVTVVSEKLVQEPALHFVSRFAVIDGKTEKDYYEILRKNMVAIVANFSAVDGFLDSGETSVACRKIFELMADNWNRLKKKAKRRF